MQQTLSSPVFLECYDKHAGKDSGVKLAMELAGLTGKTLVCIGDYYNDLEMLKTADISAAPISSPDDIKSSAKYITVPCDDGAVAVVVNKE